MALVLYSCDHLGARLDFALKIQNVKKCMEWDWKEQVVSGDSKNVTQYHTTVSDSTKPFLESSAETLQRVPGFRTSS